MRLRILSDDDIEGLYGRPRFTQEERNEFFALPAQEKAALEQLHSLKSKAFFILQLGYFKARHMFFILAWFKILGFSSNSTDRPVPRRWSFFLSPDR